MSDEELRLAEEEWNKLSRRIKLKFWLHFIFIDNMGVKMFGFELPPLWVVLAVCSPAIILWFLMS